MSCSIIFITGPIVAIGRVYDVVGIIPGILLKIISLAIVKLKGIVFSTKI